MLNSYPVSVIIRQVTWQQAIEALSFIRRTVFIAEQDVPEELEWDGLDDDAIHILAVNADAAPVGTARMLSDGHIGRMAVLRDWRKQGIGGDILQKLIAIAQAQAWSKVELDAQTHALAFYARHGFIEQGKIFMDAGMPHKRMMRSLVE